MAFDRQSLYISAHGEIGTGGGAGEDIFSFGLRASGDTGFDAVDALAELDVPGIAAIFGTYFEAAGTKIETVGHLYKVKVAALGTDGKYLTDSIEAEPEPGGSNGSVSAVRYPNQVALAVSLRTVTNIGRATKGRFYLPVPGHNVQTDGKIIPAEVVATAATSKTFLDALNTKLAADITQTIRLQIMSDIGSGVSRVVTSVRVGDVIDTIRSRRNALTETYSSATLA